MSFITPQDTTIGFTDNTTNNASTTKHGFLPKLNNTATNFLDMTGSQRALAWSDFPNGTVVQVIPSLASAVATGSTAIPNDDTIPQNTEGVEFMTATITPKATTNILVIQVKAMLACAAVKLVSGALFQDSTANAIAAAMTTAYLVGAPNTLVFSYSMAAGTTSATTFKFRAGAEDASVVTFNGIAGGRKFGAIAKSSIVIYEYKA